MHGLLLSLYVSYDWKQRCIPPARGLVLFLTLLSAMLEAFYSSRAGFSTGFVVYRKLTSGNSIPLLSDLWGNTLRRKFMQVWVSSVLWALEFEESHVPLRHDVIISQPMANKKASGVARDLEFRTMLYLGSPAAGGGRRCRKLKN